MTTNCDDGIAEIEKKYCGNIIAEIVRKIKVTNYLRQLHCRNREKKIGNTIAEIGGKNIFPYFGNSIAVNGKKKKKKKKKERKKLGNTCNAIICDYGNTCGNIFIIFITAIP